MTSTRPEPAAGRPRSRAARSVALALAVGLGAALSACGSSTPSSATTAAVVKPPVETVQACTYAPDGKVPSGEPQGVQPPFPAFTTDEAGTSALQHIADHGGTGLVAGFQLPTGTRLYAGPDASSATVGTIGEGRSILLLDPVLWTTSSGRHWLVSFLACGGDQPYWVDVDQVAQADPTVGSALSSQITTLLATQDYATTGHASSLPVIVTPAKRFAWKDSSVPFSPARGEYVGFGV